MLRRGLLFVEVDDEGLELFIIFPNEALVFELSVSELVKPTQDAPEAEEAPAEAADEELETLVVDLDEE